MSDVSSPEEHRRRQFAVYMFGISHGKVGEKNFRFLDDVITFYIQQKPPLSRANFISILDCYLLTVILLEMAKLSDSKIRHRNMGLRPSTHTIQFFMYLHIAIKWLGLPFYKSKLVSFIIFVLTLMISSIVDIQAYWILFLISENKLTGE